MSSLYISKKRRIGTYFAAMLHDRLHDCRAYLSSVTVIQPGDNLSVRKHSFRGDIEQPQALPDATGYTYLAKPLDLQSPFRKRMEKNSASLTKICHLLTGTGSPAATIGPESFISRPGLQDKRKDASMADIYTKLHQSFPTGFESAQYFKAHASRATEVSDDPPSVVNIKTGLCLFSSPSLTLSPGHGVRPAHVPPLPNDLGPTIYELEILCRLSSSIADVVGLVRQKGVTASLSPISVDIADFQYYWTACVAFQRGLVSMNYVQDWMRAIDLRRCQLADMLTYMLKIALHDRGLAGEDILFSSSPGDLKSFIKECVLFGRVPNLDDLLTEMQEDAACGWSYFYAQLNDKKRVSTVEDLGRLLYVYNIVQDAFHSPASRGKRLVVHVEDAAEWRIFKYAKSVLKAERRQGGKTSIVGLFPLAKLLVAGSGRSELYHEPAHWLTSSYSNALFEVIGKAYGPRMARSLQQCCYDNGLLQ